jgi:hypothetical protein
VASGLKTLYDKIEHNITRLAKEQRADIVNGVREEPRVINGQTVMVKIVPPADVNGVPDYSWRGRDKDHRAARRADINRDIQLARAEKRDEQRESNEYDKNRRMRKASYHKKQSMRTRSLKRRARARP